MKEIDKYSVERYKDRYIIVDIDVGEVFDDAQGYGFKTKNAAYKCLVYKIKHNNPEFNVLKDKYNIIIKKYKYLKNISNDLSYILFDYFKNGEQMTNTEMSNFILSQIEENIPELFLELNDNKIRTHFLKKFLKDEGFRR